MMFSRMRRFLFGTPLNPLGINTRQHIALIALFAWVGLGADALSSSCYGPEQAYLVLGDNSHLAVFVAAITIVTIFIIAMGYNRVIELFPSGGGGYKVATKLLHPYVGLISGAALIVDYVLTISVSIASGADAFFSFLPLSFSHYKLYIEAAALLLMLALNMRGMKETIKILLPIFLGFVVIHFILILYGIAAHSKALKIVIPNAMHESYQLAQAVGWLAVIALTLRAYSLGAGTYTGLEAISNNVQRLAEPRIKTGKRAMLYMSISLSFTAGGILLLYMLWAVKPVEGQTLNAVVFHSILGDSSLGQAILILTLQLEAALLFIAANTGFVDGPNVLANMAFDGWLPNRFRHLSSRLAVQNGLMLMGLGALAILFLTNGNVSFLVVLYSINVFITFTLSLLSLSVYWATHRESASWLGHFILSAFACLTTFSILCITIFFKFTAGGWLTLIITSSLVGFCLLIKRHYQYVASKLKRLDEALCPKLAEATMPMLPTHPNEKTAVVFVSGLSMGMHTLLALLRFFPEQFKNFVFLRVGVVDTESFRGQAEMEELNRESQAVLNYFINFCAQQGLPAEAYMVFGTDIIESLLTLTKEVSQKYPDAIFFASELIFANDNMLTRFLHNHTALLLQQGLHMEGKELVIIPMQI